MQQLQRYISEKSDLREKVLDFSDYNGSFVFADNDPQDLFRYINDSFEEIDMSMFDFSNVTDMRSLFKDMNNVKRIKLPSVMNCPKLETTSEMFYGCHNLEEVNLDGLSNTKLLSNMNEMFYQCLKITKINMPNIDLSRISNMYGMFNSCEKLEDLNINFKHDFNDDIMDPYHSLCLERMFDRCISLKSVDLSDFKTANIRTMGYMFSECVNLQTVLLPNFKTNYCNNYSYMFNNCYNIYSLNLESFRFDNTAVTHNMFRNCRSLTMVNLLGFCQNISTKRRQCDFETMFPGCNDSIYVVSDNADIAHNMTTDITDVDLNAIADMLYDYNSRFKCTDNNNYKLSVANEYDGLPLGFYILKSTGAIIMIHVTKGRINTSIKGENTADVCDKIRSVKSLQEMFDILKQYFDSKN